MQEVKIKPNVSKKHRGRFPKRIKIAGMTLPIFTCDSIAILDDKTNVPIGSAKGAYNSETGWIFIENRHSNQFTQETLLHECIHAIDGLNNLELSEDQVKHLAKDMYDLIMNNPIFRRKFDG